MLGQPQPPAENRDGMVRRALLYLLGGEEPKAKPKAVAPPPKPKVGPPEMPPGPAGDLASTLLRWKGNLIKGMTLGTATDEDIWGEKKEKEDE